MASNKSMIPKSKTRQYLDQISLIAEGELPYSALDDVERQTVNLTYLDQKQVLGAIASVRQNSKETDQQFQAALKASGRNSIILMNYSTSLNTLGRVLEAAKLAHEAVQIDPLDTAILHGAAQVFLDAYDLEKLADVCLKLDKLQVNLNLDGTKFDVIEKVKDLMGNYDVDSRAIGQRIEFATEHIRRAGLRISSVTEFVDDELIQYTFNLDGSPDKIAETEASLGDALATLPYSPADSVMVFLCSKAEA